METFANFILFGCNGTITTGSGASASNSQFTFIDSNGNVGYRLFTDKGRYVVKVLNALGYSIPQGVDLSTGSNWLSTEGSYNLSAYPLLAFFKAYNDYMSQSQRFNISALSAFLRGVKQNKSVGGYYPATGQIDYNGISLLFDNLYLCYDNDYFTSAWRYPVSPLGVGTEPQLSSAGVPASSLEGVENNNQYVDLQSYRTDGSEFQISQRALDWLKSFDA